ncbi:hypothetical protein CXG81DRAFT_17587 [Caulochytrium protostelioides]|uniref:PH domain-containing protein n=1 Tax=Caulochytrium protostelioides TaxID=1555241 RepID=A0A4P9XC94_9FUNG|nr:hypothetical protein CXG81DRAFT_17587 [Caulochytrium protostelioides]|eukprot:RKP02790.1 hypothetical protein CXG81DRAFT_17587 [Caulochytrium protostelioides]
MSFSFPSSGTAESPASGKWPSFSLPNALSRDASAASLHSSAAASPATQLPLSVAAGGGSSAEPEEIDPLHGLIPTSVTPLFLNRLQEWTKVIKALINHFSTIADADKRLAAAYTKSIARDFGPQGVSNGRGFGEGDSQTLRDFIQAFADDQTAEAQQHSARAQFIEATTLPALRDLATEIRKKSTDNDREWVAMDKGLKFDRDTLLRLQAEMRAGLERAHARQLMSPHHATSTAPIGDGELDTSPATPTTGPSGMLSLVNGSANATKDPYITSRQLRKHIEECFRKQREHRESILNQRQNFAIFEKVIVQHLRNLLTTWMDSRYRFHHESLTQVLTKIRASLDHVNPDTDWQAFEQQHQNLFVDPDAPFTQPEELPIEGDDDPLVNVITQGALLRQETGLMTYLAKRWKQQHGILSAAGYLHMYPASTEASPPPSFYANLVEPEISLYMPECQVDLAAGTEDVPEEFIVTQNPGTFRANKVRLRGSTPDVTLFWWSFLSSQMRVPPTPVAAAGTPTTAAKPAAAAAAPPVPPKSALPTNAAAATPPAIATAIAAGGINLMDSTPTPKTALSHSGTPPLSARHETEAVSVSRLQQRMSNVVATQAGATSPGPASAAASQAQQAQQQVLYDVSHAYAESAAYGQAAPADATGNAAEEDEEDATDTAAATAGAPTTAAEAAWASAANRLNLDSLLQSSEFDGGNAWA